MLAAAQVESPSPISAIARDLRIGTSFSRLSSSSRAASNTIMINPTIPRTSSIGKKSMVTEVKYCKTYCKITPNAISINTAGMLVFLDKPLKRKERIMITENSMIRLYEEMISIRHQNFLWNWS